MFKVTIYHGEQDIGHGSGDTLERAEAAAYNNCAYTPREIAEALCTLECEEVRS